MVNRDSSLVAVPAAPGKPRDFTCPPHPNTNKAQHLNALNCRRFTVLISLSDAITKETWPERRQVPHPPKHPRSVTSPLKLRHAAPQKSPRRH